ncbi:MAG: FKBP-type peptidyl-prolyl cis-trans isomerase [Candidatus Kariarchaeaceae archaeon]|jgi:FKBP-type peptidyl-prolyl cis-trans isomerase 2
MIKSGSMITIDYTAKISDENNGTVFDTTNEEVAKNEALYVSDKIYEPMLVVIGKGWIPIGLETALQKANVGEKFNVNVPCEEAYGPKDPSKIKLVARREFQKLNINPSIGDRITLGLQTGTVLSVSSGRVRMDYNHVLAGKDIEYDIEIHYEITGDAKKIAALIKRRIPGADLEDMKILIDGKVIKVNMPESARYFEYIQFAKKEAASDIAEIVPGYKEIEFIDYFSL